MYLLDVNCLVALAWPNHIHHHRMGRWFSAEGKRDWATTPEIQAGFIRVSMNAAVTGADVSFDDARSTLRQLLSIGTHTAVGNNESPLDWPDWLWKRVQGYRQMTDASFIACATKHRRKLATLDDRITDLTGESHRDLLELVPV